MPINLAGGGRAGGVGDALLEIVKQRLLEQELNQRQQDQELSRRRQDRLDARQVEQDNYNRGRDTANDARLKESDRISKETRDQQNALARAAALKGMPQEDINASLGTDPSTVKWNQVPTPHGMPKTGAPSYAPSPMLSNAIDLGNGVKMRPPSMEQLDKAATIDKERDIEGQIRVAEAGKTPPRPAQLQHVDGGSFNPETGEYKKSDGWVPEKPVSGSGGLSTNQELLAIDRLSKTYDKARAPIVEMQRQSGIMRQGLEAAKRGDLAQGAQAVLVTFQKILDPTSVVRESEYMRSAAGQSLMNQMEGAVQKLSKGGAGVTYDELVKFAALADKMATTENQYVEGVKKRLSATAKQFQINPELIFSDFGDAPRDATPPPAPASASDPLGIRKGGG